LIGPGAQPAQQKTEAGAFGITLCRPNSDEGETTVVTDAFVIPGLDHALRSITGDQFRIIKGYTAGAVKVCTGVMLRYHHGWRIAEGFLIGNREPSLVLASIR
jgi:hypothetical protein